jgi:hypothetical protein
MTIRQALNRGRVLAERNMCDSCTVTRRVGETIGAGGVIIPTTSVVYTGKCRLASRGSAGSWVDVGEASRLTTGLVLQLPVTAPALVEGDRVTMTSSVFDQQLIGKIFAVRDASRSSLATRTEVAVIAVSS